MFAFSKIHKLAIEYNSVPGWDGVEDTATLVSQPAASSLT